MSKADDIFVSMCSDIIEHGTTTEGQKVRPHWEDGTPAHTIKSFGVCNRYDLREEFPALTLRRTALKTAMDELLWIWQKKSNNIHDLSPTSGTSGRTRRLHRQGLRLSAGREAPLSRGRLRPDGPGPL